jgi:hypothetical protein
MQMGFMLLKSNNRLSEQNAGGSGSITADKLLNDCQPLMHIVLQNQLKSADFPLQEPGFQPGSSHVGTVVDRAALGQVFSEYFNFPCHSFIPLITPQLSPFVIQSWYKWPFSGHSTGRLGSTPAP